MHEDIEDVPPHLFALAAGRLERCRTLRDLCALLSDRQLGELVDWSDLPTYGGEAPAELHAVWSWDEDALLVGETQRELRLIDRPTTASCAPTETV